MRLGQVLSSLEDRVEAAGAERAALAYVFRELKGWSLTDLVLQLSQPITPADELLLTELADKLSQHLPAQHLTGRAYFRELTLLVDSRVLIPRPETEELVDLILLENSRADLRVLDLGTGSGAIALSLKQAREDWQVTASDLSADALAVARENAQKHDLAVTFIQSDVYDGLAETYDLIVSNPPYIAYADQHEVGENVLRYEPHTALFAEEEGLAIYRQILRDAQQHLTPDGKIYLEIGYKQGQALKALAQQYLPDKRVRVLADSYGKDRMVVIDHG
ncbi:peptide chain release factor N(5)-glutamine methyltransferase [Streptococcus ovuberis]|uniref:Release factor glutamine methyltransferase n=1 Tax=Streptococcus ovuberis TaxID=1936207 RepID=A0A7X6S2E1_9STRE|nr:peptide chain release factor N(5)-glutamine methyltransferase [Streptococcus ovuberis]NKZ21151.1 peptide chain release factor N(5)-glutamine methyltransferase [Streptococcus ovuberis]